MGISFSKLPEHFSGTSTVALIGEDTIYVVADGKSSCWYSHSNSKEYPTHYLSLGDEEKIYSINEAGTIIATMSGDDYTTCIEILEHVSSKVDNKGDLMVAKTAAKESIRQLKDKKTKNGRIENVELLLCGWGEERPTVYKIGLEDGNDIDEEINEVGKVISTGSGGDYAQEFVVNTMENMRNNNLSLNTHDEYFDMLSKAIVVASLKDSHTGGYVRACYLTKTTHSPIEVKGHVVNLLRLHMDELRDKVEGGVFILNETGARYRGKQAGKLELAMKKTIRNAGREEHVQIHRLDEKMVTLGVRRIESTNKKGKKEVKTQILRFIKLEEEADLYNILTSLKALKKIYVSRLSNLSRELPDVHFKDELAKLTDAEKKDILLALKKRDQENDK